MLASRVLITAGTPGHMYLEERQAKCLQREGEGEGHGAAAPKKGCGVRGACMGNYGEGVWGKLGQHLCICGRLQTAAG